MICALAGMDPMRLMESRDQVEIVTMLAIAQKVAELRAEER